MKVPCTSERMFLQSLGTMYITVSELTVADNIPQIFLICVVQYGGHPTHAAAGHLWLVMQLGFEDDSMANIMQTIRK